MFKSKKIKKYLVIIVIILFITIMFNLPPSKKNIEYIESFDKISEPIQTNTSGGITKIIDGKTISLTYKAEYSISGRVVGIHTYFLPISIENNLSPKDIGISWGFLARDENHKNVKWSTWAKRGLLYKVDDIQWLKSIGGLERVSSSCSNNHIIPSNDNIKKLILKIKKDDYVKLNGYLVDVYSSDGRFKWTTSTTRTDVGNSCEILYVMEVKWLKEK